MHERGIAILEAATFTLTILGLIVGGAAVADCMSKMMLLEQAIDRAVNDHAEKVLVSNDFSGRFQIQIDPSSARREIENIAANVEVLLSKNLGDTMLQAVPYRIEVAYAVLDIDGSSGAPLGLGVLPYSDLVSRGDLLVPNSVSRQVDLGAAFASRAAHTQVNSDVSLYARPTQFFTSPRSDRRFVSQVILVGARAFVSLKGSFSGNAYATLGGEPIVYESKVVTLRGDLQ